MHPLAPLGLALLMGVGCGVAAHPLSTRGLRVESPVPNDASQTAWVVCPRARDPTPAGTTVVARYRGCALVVGDGVDPELQREGEMRLGSAQHLRKVDAGLLLKALLRWDTLHLVVEHDGPASPGEYYHPTHREVGCHVRGMGFDYDCPRASIPRLLAHEHVVQVEVWNRFWVRWK